MVWAAIYGVYTGSDGKLNPKTDAARKVVAQMLYNFINADISNEEPAPATEPVVGGWGTPDSVVLTDDLKGIFDKAIDDLVGVDYTPVAVVGRQLVAGMNYLYLCRAKAVVPDAVEKYSFVTVYADLEGGAKITDVIATDVETNIPSEALDGGWWIPESPEINDSVKNAFDKALESVDTEYDPIAVLAEQVVSGMNYCLLCRTTAAAPGAVTEYIFVTIYADLEGGAEITDLITLSDAE